MKAIVFHGLGDIRLDNVKEPKIKDDGDAIVRLTADDRGPANTDVEKLAALVLGSPEFQRR